MTTEMNEDEMRARAEAATMGQLEMIQAAIEALIAVSAKSDYIQFRLAQCLAEIQNRPPEHPSLAWVAQAMGAGAAHVTDRFIRACQANMATRS